MHISRLNSIKKTKSLRAFAKRRSITIAYLKVYYFFYFFTLNISVIYRIDFNVITYEHKIKLSNLPYMQPCNALRIRFRCVDKRRAERFSPKSIRKQRTEMFTDHVLRSFPGRSIVVGIAYSNTIADSMQYLQIKLTCKNAFGIWEPLL